MNAAARPRKIGTDPGASGVLMGLLVRIARKEEAALERFYDLTRRRIYGLALRLLGDVGLAEEAALDVYTQVWRTADSFDPGRGSVWCWLLLLTRTRAYDIRRSRGRMAPAGEVLEAAGEVADPGQDPSVASEEAEEAHRVREALLGLPEPQREAIQCAYFGGRSYTETAAALGLPEGTVKTRIRHALQALRRVLMGEERS